MHPTVDTRRPEDVEVEVESHYRAMFPDGDPLFVNQVFAWTVECFRGHYADYQPIDARYHDLEHTMQGTLCMARLLRGRHEAGAQPRVSRRMFELGLVAILLHDTGYLKKRDDTEGTGAKYTSTHVDRSADFAAQLLAEKGFAREEIQSARNMIHCTGVDAALATVPFQNEQERIVGLALGTADLLGQMAADDYVDKLPILYSEFEEAAQHDHNGTGFVTMFHSAEELMRKTPGFWKSYVRPKIEREFGGLYRFLNQPYPDGRNSYLEKIGTNIERLESAESGTARK